MAGAQAPRANSSSSVSSEHFFLIEIVDKTEADSYHVDVEENGNLLKY